jgi:hypothetical protein
MNNITFTSSGNTFSAFVRKNSMYNRFADKFLDLARTKLLPVVGNPELKVSNFPVQINPGEKPENFLRFDLTYKSQLNNPIVLDTIANEFLTFVEAFTSRAIESMLRSSEFIPLSGYSFSNLKKEVVEALKANRKFIIIKDYDQYLGMKPSGTNSGFNFDIKVIDPKENRDEYAEVYCILQKNTPKQAQKILKERYKDQLQRENWYSWC